MRYRTIVADPPWDHGDGTGVTFSRGGRVTGLPYSTMTLDEIKTLPVREMSDNRNPGINDALVPVATRWRRESLDGRAGRVTRGSYDRGRRLFLWFYLGTILVAWIVALVLVSTARACGVS